MSTDSPTPTRSSSPTEELRLEIDGDRWRPVPQEWVDEGDPETPYDEFKQLFATLVTLGETELRVRYVHPREDAVAVRTFEATIVDETIAPRGLVEDDRTWPPAITVDYRDDPADVVRQGERRLLADLHDVDEGVSR